MNPIKIKSKVWFKLKWRTSCTIIETDSSYCFNFFSARVAKFGEISNRIGTERSTITRENLLDLCASEFVCVDLDDSTRTVLLQELSLDDDVKCEGGEFTSAVAEVLTMISTSKEYQML